MEPLRVIFMGSSPLSAVSLQALLDSPVCRVIAVVTQPDRPKGRDLKLRATPVKELALRAPILVLQPERARSPDFVSQARALQPDLIAVAAYGQILSKDLLDVPRFGCLNVHTSLLPRWRGAAPIQTAILNDEPETGVTIMKMDEGLDTGPIIAQESTPIRPEDDAQTLHDRLAEMGARLLATTLPDYVSGTLPLRSQPTEGATYAPKIKKKQGLIDWSRPARQIWNQVRGLVPWPGAFTHVPAQPQPHLLKIWKAQAVPGTGPPGEVLSADKAALVIACGAHALQMLELQREGGRRLTAQQFLAGFPLSCGTRLA